MQGGAGGAILMIHQAAAVAVGMLALSIELRSSQFVDCAASVGGGAVAVLLQQYSMVHKRNCHPMRWDFPGRYSSK